MTAKQKKFIEELKTRVFTFDRHGHCENEVRIQFAKVSIYGRKEDNRYDVHMSGSLICLREKEPEDIFSERTQRAAKAILERWDIDCPELLAFLSPLQEPPKEKGFAFEQLSMF